MAQLSKPPVPAKMYRHFAAITVLFTAGLAMFAQGENAKLHDEQAQATGPSAGSSTRRENSTTPRYGEARLTRNDNDMGGFYGDTGMNMDFGEPMIRQHTSGIVPASLAESDPQAVRLSEDYLASLSKEEREQLEEQLRAAGLDSEPERLRAVAALEATSRRRIGS